MKPSIVDIVGLSRRFGKAQALENVSFNVLEGQVYGIVGANGAGKTTLIKHLLGLLRAQSGTVRVFGLDPVRDPVGVLQRVGYLSEDRELPEWMRIDDLLRYMQAYYPSWDAAYARKLVDSFGLDCSQKIKQLSQGMRAQAGLAAAVAHRPELLVLDEPSSGLDTVVRRDILDAIVRMVVDDGRTVIFSSHLLEEVERMSDQVIMMQSGRIVLDGAVDQIRGRHRRTSVRFQANVERLGAIPGVLSCEGSGRSWVLMHGAALEEIRSTVEKLGGQIVQSRDATLEEVFVARAGRGAPANPQPRVEAA
jgi:ABC-2 type transport system ATP-binding protein